MNREADLGQVCLLHTRRVRSLPGAVSNPARLHRTAQTPALTKATCKYHPERRGQAEERFDCLGRENKPEAPSSFLGRGACVAAPALCVIGYTRAVPGPSCWCGSTFSASLGSLPWVSWWDTGTAMSRLHPFTSRVLHKRMGAWCSVLWNVWSARGAFALKCAQ